MRSQGGTMFFFGSAIEDIGLNINETNNKVVLSHYAILNIPVDSSIATTTNKFNLGQLAIDSSTAISKPVDSAEINYNDAKKIIATSFQNYALNCETVIRNNSDYDVTLSKTVSERVFWKWLKRTGAISWYYDDVSLCYREGIVNNSVLDTNYSSVVKGFGKISASAKRSDDYNINNETYVNIPSSYGLMECLFKYDSDKNYSADNRTFVSTTANYLIENCQSTTSTGDINVTANGLSAIGQFDSSSNNYGVYNVSDQTESLGLVIDISELQTIYDNNTLTYDNLAIDNSQATTYDFNTILIYYSIYTPDTNAVLSTNLLGVFFLDSPVNAAGSTYPSNLNFNIPTLNKKKTSSVLDGDNLTGFGTSYSFKLNVKSSSLYDSTDSSIYDNTTSAASIVDNLNDVIYNLNVMIENLQNNSLIISNISNDYQSIKSYIETSNADISKLKINVNKLLNGNIEDISTNEVITNSLTTDVVKLNGDVSILDSSSNVIGYVSDTSLTFRKFSVLDNIVTTDVSVNNNISLNNGIVFNPLSELNIYGNKIPLFYKDSNGNLNNFGQFNTNNTLYLSADIVTDSNYEKMAVAGNSPVVADESIEAFVKDCSVVLDGSIYKILYTAGDDTTVYDNITKDFGDSSIIDNNSIIPLLLRMVSKLLNQ